MRRCQSINPELKIILTVSPVPLVATYEPRHVLSSTSASKGILRALGDEVERDFKNVYYFPSYEIITCPAHAGRYYADDLREVTPLGVNHVMRMFCRHFLGFELLNPSRCSNGSFKSFESLTVETSDDSGVVCDEQVIADAIQAAQP